MAAQALKLAVDQLSIMPPTFDLSKSLALVKEIEDFERVVSRAETETLAWRARTIAHLRAGREALREVEKETSREAMAAALLPRLTVVQETLAKAEASLSQPFDQRPDIAEGYRKLASTSPAAARFMRKQFKRAEVIRQNFIDAYQTYRAILQAVEWDYDSDARGGPAFENADDLIAYLNT